MSTIAARSYLALMPQLLAAAGATLAVFAAPPPTDWADALAPTASEPWQTTMAALGVPSAQATTH